MTVQESGLQYLKKAVLWNINGAIIWNEINPYSGRCIILSWNFKRA